MPPPKRALPSVCGAACAARPSLPLLEIPALLALQLLAARLHQPPMLPPQHPLELCCNTQLVQDGLHG